MNINQFRFLSDSNNYKYPTKGKGANSYTINYSNIGKQTFSANFENSYYDWNNMLDDYSTYSNTTNEDQYTNAVSLLMSDCGIAVNMKYNGSASGAYSKDVPIALKNYFSYSFFDDNKTLYYRDDFSNDDWMNVIYTALNNNHPILYCGQGSGGHMFVVHGYEPDGKVIVNWGWNGSYDGSYMIDMLSPGGHRYNYNQQMIIPVPKGDVVDVKYTLSYIVDGGVYKEYKLKHGEAITPEPAPSKDGYIFSGWSTIPQTMPAYDVTITGSFTKGAYKLTYLVDGRVYKTVNYDYGATITPETAPMKEGYTFSGWSNIPSQMPANDVTVTGSFTINKYKLIYQVDGLDYKSYDVDYGATITPEAEPYKDGYVFSGWSYIPSTMPAHDVTITGDFTNGTESANSVIVRINGIYYILFGKSRTAEVTESPNKYSGNITIPETVEFEGFTYRVTKIGEKAFFFCSKLSSISLPSSITIIGNEAFYLCGELTSVSIPNSVTSIGSLAFGDCSIISSIVLPNSIQEIGDNAFHGCLKLSSINIPDDVTVIHTGTFSYCSSLKSVKIPETVTSIENSAFHGCI